MIIPVILCGGAGTRLWPLSRELYPKQFLAVLGGDESLLKATARRIEGLDSLGPPIVLCNGEHRFMVAAQFQETGIKPSAIILEPVGRNTAPAVAVGAFEALREGADPVLLVLPADHVVDDTAAFAEAVRAGKSLAEQGAMITFGIEPVCPETGFGYIRKGERIVIKGEDSNDMPQSFRVNRFVEKPDLETAMEYVKSREYLWNSGMFMFKASTYLEELRQWAPRMFQYCEQAHRQSRRDLDFLRLDEPAFTDCPADSIDYAVMEKTSSAAVIPLSAGWSDVGSWSTVYKIGAKDPAANVLLGDVVAEDSTGCYIHACSRMVATVGGRDLVIVETQDAVLVAPMDRVQDVKKIVNRLKRCNREEAKVHAKVYRPWGSYECRDAGDRFQVKRITVAPGATLSMQKHHHRSEHWIVVKGTARIIRGDTELLLSEDESTYIPLGTVHRLENPGRIPLELIEVQTGSYLGEDDIVRLEDVYGRHTD